MKQTCFILLLILLNSRCTSKFEVKEDEVAVTFNNTTGEVSQDVLRKGDYEIGSSEKVVIFQTDPQHKDFSFDFLFKDASEGLIEFSIDYTPKVDSLASFYRKYKTTNLPVTVEIEIKSTVRDIALNLTKENIDSKIFFMTIERALDSELRYFIDIDHFSPKRVKYQ
ncbi:MAG TPA: SPFH domain-containing protein [Chryseolinea sp.]|nr:SPFH domain-containing protein [Chryseolinea sp.]